MEKVRRQHYVPRMYLKRFGYGNIGDEYISVLKLDNGTVLDNRKVENFAVANYFYDADKEQIAEILKEDLKVFPELCDNEKLSDEQFTEHALAREESAISKMLNELQEDLSRIHISSNRNLMVIFLHSLAYRTKQFRDQMDAINNKTEKWLNSIHYKGVSVMNAVGIDVSKGKSTVTIRKPGDVVLMPPCDIPHTQSAINDLIKQIKSLEGETKVCMEHTGRYYEPVATWLSDAGIFVSAVNPILIRDFGDDSLRTPKTDKADSKKIARYTLDRWAKLKQYGNMDKTRNQLKTMNRQFGFYMAQKTAMKNNLIALIDQTYPGANDFFDSPARSDGSQKWVDFIHTYWHVDCVRPKSLNAFTDHYQNWCKRKTITLVQRKQRKFIRFPLT